LGILEDASELAAKAKSEIPAAKDLDELNNYRVKYLGRSSDLNKYFDQVKNETPANKRAFGMALNRIKREIEDLVAARQAELTKQQENQELKQKIDVTLPGFGPERGSRHPIGLMLQEMVEIFEGMGFWVEEGPDAETDFHNFAALNFPQDHPARDMQATFYLENGLLLRTHTSPVQIRAMSRLKPPLRVICPGRVYRCDADVSHSPMFHQVEGFMVDKHITFAHLKGVLMEFLKKFFGADISVRFRPSFFPFTEPSAEVDISCRICTGQGCPACKQSGWMEVLGSGMIHPQVLKNVGYNPEEVTGFAFGLGVDRLAMLKYKIDHIRLFYEGDLRFLKQF
jgi:phenylalanyl-tRNA synthetase alpha chain